MNENAQKLFEEYKTIETEPRKRGRKPGCIPWNKGKHQTDSGAGIPPKTNPPSFGPMDSQPAPALSQNFTPDNTQALHEIVFSCWSLAYDCPRHAIDDKLGKELGLTGAAALNEYVPYPPRLVKLLIYLVTLGIAVTHQIIILKTWLKSKEPKKETPQEVKDDKTNNDKPTVMDNSIHNGSGSTSGAFDSGSFVGKTPEPPNLIKIK